MILESLVIAGILVAMVVIFLRSNKQYALMPVPLLALPVVDVLAAVFSHRLSQALNMEHIIVFALMMLIGAVISGVLAGVFSSRLQGKRQRILYFVMCAAFDLLLAGIYLVNLS